MNLTNRLALVAALATFAAVTGCDSSTGGSGASSGNGNPSTNSRFGVTDSLLGSWKGIAGTSSALDSVTITKDSMTGFWTTGTSRMTYPTTLKPYSDAKFYAHGGRMGLTNGMTVSDNVSFEYVFSGDTLFVELMGSLQPDGKVDRSSTGANFTHGWLRR
jgi:hypothetical protein